MTATRTTARRGCSGQLLHGRPRLTSLSRARLARRPRRARGSRTAVEDAPDTYYVTDYYRKYPLVLDPARRDRQRSAARGAVDVTEADASESSRLPARLPPRVLLVEPGLERREVLGHRGGIHLALTGQRFEHVRPRTSTRPSPAPSSAARPLPCCRRSSSDAAAPCSPAALASAR